MAFSAHRNQRLSKAAPPKKECRQYDLSALGGKWEEINVSE
jgi:hypothetical protein